MFAVPGLVWLAYVGLIGGDWFPFERHWEPALVCLAFALSSLLAMLPYARRWLLAGLVVSAAVLHIALQSAVDQWAEQYKPGKWSEAIARDIRAQDPNGDAERLARRRQREGRLESQRSYSECFALGQQLRVAFSVQKPLIAVNAAGCFPYVSRLPSLDMLGLNDFHIAHHRPPDMGEGPIGHELGDGSYVLSRKPDIVVLCGVNGMILGLVVPCGRGDRELTALPEFQRNYRLVFYRADMFDGAFWTRIEDGRLGITRSADTIYLPGFLLATTHGARAVLDTAGRLVTALEVGDARIADVYLPSGTWELSLKSDGLSKLQFETSPVGGNPTSRLNVLRVTSEGKALSFRVFGGPGLVYAITGRRLVEQSEGARTDDVKVSVTGTATPH